VQGGQARQQPYQSQRYEQSPRSGAGPYPVQVRMPSSTALSFPPSLRLDSAPVRRALWAVAENPVHVMTRSASDNEIRSPCVQDSSLRGYDGTGPSGTSSLRFRRTPAHTSATYPFKAGLSGLYMRSLHSQIRAPVAAAGFDGGACPAPRRASNGDTRTSYQQGQLSTRSSTQPVRTTLRHPVTLHLPRTQRVPLSRQFVPLW